MILYVFPESNIVFGTDFSKAADYAYQRYRFEMSLRMTPEEMRAEVQAVEGNPHIAAGRQGIRQAWQRSRD